MTLKAHDGIPKQIPQSMVSHGQLGYKHPIDDETFAMKSEAEKPIRTSKGALETSPPAVSHDNRGNLHEHNYKHEQSIKTFKI